ncbi:uncharacterized protein LOC127874435 isoform X2 [Dreissena polymorpha]|uniref:Uncharacterized protein n=1 Tax=Dreissena polymorpha TaxID=45954 RepID=A0A9D4R171_DREPO|nr:uncharacterized protein LOC127874435 isoform X2 [Dreissena polymorpha]KAH3850232.1 hypothetical protein DPMN_092639 [Dreissena polymorpha]
MIMSQVCACALMLCGITLATNSCKNSTRRCVPIVGPESDNICVSISNGTGVDWFQAKNECEADGGRLAHIGNYSTEHGLTTVAHVAHVRVGILASVRGDQMTFMRNTNETFCTNKTTQKCSSTMSPSDCNALGCCFNGTICQYPEKQFVATIDLNSTRLHSYFGTERLCVQLYSNKSWSPYNCSEPGDAETVYACERKCSTNWPLESNENVSWVAPGAISPLIPEYATTGSAAHSASVNTPTAMSSIGTVKETSSDGNQNIACQFNVQVLRIVKLLSMSFTCS